MPCKVQMFLPQTPCEALLAASITCPPSRGTYLQIHGPLLFLPWRCGTWLTVALRHCSWWFQRLLGTPASSILAFRFHCLLSYNDLTFHPPQLPFAVHTVITHDRTASTGSISSIPFSELHLLSGSLPLVPQLQQFIDSLHVSTVLPHPKFLNSTTHHYFSLHCTCSDLPYTQPWLITSPSRHLHLNRRHPNHWVGEHIIMLISHTSDLWLQTPSGTLLLPDVQIIFP